MAKSWKTSFAFSLVLIAAISICGFASGQQVQHYSGHLQSPESVLSGKTVYSDGTTSTEAVPFNIVHPSGLSSGLVTPHTNQGAGVISNPNVYYEQSQVSGQGYGNCQSPTFRQSNAQMGTRSPRSLPQGRRYIYGHRYFGTINNRFYGPQYGNF